MGIRGPYGSHWPLEAAEGGDLVIVAGGIGLPPLRPAIYATLGRRDSFRRIVLLYDRSGCQADGTVATGPWAWFSTACMTVPGP